MTADRRDAPPRIILTDQFAPVDNLMAEVFRHRYEQPEKEKKDQDEGERP